MRLSKAYSAAKPAPSLSRLFQVRTIGDCGNILWSRRWCGIIHSDSPNPATAG